MNCSVEEGIKTCTVPGATFRCEFDPFYMRVSQSGPYITTSEAETLVNWRGSSNVCCKISNHPSDKRVTSTTKSNVDTFLCKIAIQNNAEIPVCDPSKIPEKDDSPEWLSSWLSPSSWLIKFDFYLKHLSDKEGCQLSQTINYAYGEYERECYIHTTKDQGCMKVCEIAYDRGLLGNCQPKHSAIKNLKLAYIFLEFSCIMCFCLARVHQLLGRHLVGAE